MGNAKRLTIDLPNEVYDKIQQIADERNITLTAALRQAIATEDFIRTQVENGGKVLIQKRDKTFTEVVFR